MSDMTATRMEIASHRRLGKSKEPTGCGAGLELGACQAFVPGAACCAPTESGKLTPFRLAGKKVKRAGETPFPRQGKPAVRKPSVAVGSCLGEFAAGAACCAPTESGKLTFFRLAEEKTKRAGGRPSFVRVNRRYEGQRRSSKAKARCRAEARR